MTVLNLVEQVRDQFPKYSRTWLLFDINNRLQRFAKKTECVLGVTDYAFTDFTIVTVNGVDQYEMTIPGAMYKILDIDIFKHNEYAIINNKLTIYTWPDSVDTISVTYCKLPDAVTDNGDELSIPSEFHNYILYDMLGMFYAAVRNLQMSQFYLALAHVYEIDAKRYANERHQISRYTTAAVAGTETLFAYGQQSVTAGENTITMNTTFSNTTYAVSMNYGNVQAAETDPKVRTTNTFKILSADDNSAFEYMAVGI